MKRPLNLNQYGGKAIAVILAMLGLSAGLYLLSSGQPAPAPLWQAVRILARLSLILGVASLALFILLLLAEQIQDHLYDRVYRRQQGYKLPTSGEFFECQYCGSRQVRPGDARCPVCNQEFQQPGSG
ncbi:MAG: hypothetical protein AB1894_14620 [Chloroflexota bacterium]